MIDPGVVPRPLPPPAPPAPLAVRVVLVELLPSVPVVVVLVVVLVAPEGPVVVVVVVVDLLPSGFVVAGPVVLVVLEELEAKQVGTPLTLPRVPGHAELPGGVTEGGGSLQEAPVNVVSKWPRTPYKPCAVGVLS